MPPPGVGQVSSGMGGTGGGGQLAPVVGLQGCGGKGGWLEGGQLAPVVGLQGCGGFAGIHPTKPAALAKQALS